MVAKRNFLWSFVIIGVGVLMLLLALDMLPTGVGDIMTRSWAILLVIAGLNMLIGERIRFGNWLALAVSLVLLGGVVYLGYINRIDDVRTENVQTLAPIPLGDHIESVNVRVATLNTTVKFEATADLARVVGAQYIGSEASDVRLSAQENEPGIVELVIEETQSSTLPAFNDVGISQLVVTLPVGVTISSLEFNSERGLITLDFRVLNVQTFNVVAANGNVELYLPLNLPAEQSVTGDLRLDNGNLRVIVPATLPIAITNAPQDQGRRDLNMNIYEVLLAGNNTVTIQSQNVNEFQVALKVSLAAGTLTVKDPAEITQ